MCDVRPLFVQRQSRFISKVPICLQTRNIIQRIQPREYEDYVRVHQLVSLPSCFYLIVWASAFTVCKSCQLIKSLSKERMCCKAALGTKYQKCGHRVEGVKKVYKCKDYPKDCDSPKLNNSITNNKYLGYCLDYVAVGNTNQIDLRLKRQSDVSCPAITFNFFTCASSAPQDAVSTGSGRVEQEEAVGLRAIYQVYFVLQKAGSQWIRGRLVQSKGDRWPRQSQVKLARKMILHIDLESLSNIFS